MAPDNKKAERTSDFNETAGLAYNELSRASEKVWQAYLARGCLGKSANDQLKLYSRIRALSCQQLKQYEPPHSSLPHIEAEDEENADTDPYMFGDEIFTEEPPEPPEPPKSAVLFEDLSQPPGAAGDSTPVYFTNTEFFQFLWSDDWGGKITLRVLGGQLLTFLLNCLARLEKTGYLYTHPVYVNLNNRCKRETAVDFLIHESASAPPPATGPSTEHLAPADTKTPGGANAPGNAKTPGGTKRSGSIKSIKSPPNAKTPGDTKTHGITKTADETETPDDTKMSGDQKLSDGTKTCVDPKWVNEQIVAQLVFYDKAEVSNMLYAEREVTQSDSQDYWPCPTPLPATHDVIRPPYAHKLYPIDQLNLPAHENVDVQRKIETLSGQLEAAMNQAAQDAAVEKELAPTGKGNKGKSSVIEVGKDQPHRGKGGKHVPQTGPQFAVEDVEWIADYPFIGDLEEEIETTKAPTSSEVLTKSHEVLSTEVHAETETVEGESLDKDERDDPRQSMKKDEKDPRQSMRKDENDDSRRSMKTDEKDHRQSVKKDEKDHRRSMKKDDKDHRQSVTKDEKDHRQSVKRDEKDHLQQESSDALANLDSLQGSRYDMDYESEMGFFSEGSYSRIDSASEIMSEYEDAPQVKLNLTRNELGITGLYNPREANRETTYNKLSKYNRLRLQNHARTEKQVRNQFETKTNVDIHDRFKVLRSRREIIRRQTMAPKIPSKPHSIMASISVDLWECYSRDQEKMELAAALIKDSETAMLHRLLMTPTVFPVTETHTKTTKDKGKGKNKSGNKSMAKNSNANSNSESTEPTPRIDVRNYSTGGSSNATNSRRTTVNRPMNADEINIILDSYYLPQIQGKWSILPRKSRAGDTKRPPPRKQTPDGEYHFPIINERQRQHYEKNRIAAERKRERRRRLENAQVKDIAFNTKYMDYKYRYKDKNMSYLDTKGRYADKNMSNSDTEERNTDPRSKVTVNRHSSLGKIQNEDNTETTNVEEKIVKHDRSMLSLASSKPNLDAIFEVAEISEREQEDEAEQGEESQGASAEQDSEEAKMKAIWAEELKQYIRECECDECINQSELLADLRPEDKSKEIQDYPLHLGKLRRDYKCLAKKDQLPKMPRTQVVSHFQAIKHTEACGQILQLLDTIMVRKEILSSSRGHTYVTITFTKGEAFKSLSNFASLLTKMSRC